MNLCRVSADYHASDVPIMADFTSGGAPVTPAGVARAVRHHVVDSFFCSYYLSRIQWPDFDMFNSYDRGGRAYAVASALSNGLVYLSDEPRRVNLDIVRRLCFADGRVPQPDAPGRPLERLFFESPNATGKPFVVHAPSRGALLVGIFNLADDSRPVRGRIPLSELPLPAARQYALWRHFAGQGEVLSAKDAIAFALEPLDVELVVLAPVVDGHAVLGLVDKMISPAGVQSHKVQDGHLEAELYEPGRLAVAAGGKITVVESAHRTAWIRL
jgi:hypothetical protein